MTTRLSKPQYDVLNAVALKKMADHGALATATGLPDAEISSAVAGLAGDELVVDMGGSVLPTDAAVPTLEQDAATFYADLRVDPDVLAAADRFEPVNTAFLGVMSAWQLVEVAGRKVTNDHTDPDYDGKVIDRLVKLVRRLGGILATFESHDERFARYGRRFDQALSRVDRDQTEFVSSPTVDSVHNVWFEFHEDLLRTLGRQRVE